MKEKKTHMQHAGQTSLSIAQATESDWNIRRIAEIGCSASSITPSANPLSNAPEAQTD